MKNPEVKIECPHCHKTIPLSESLARPFIERERAVLDERERALLSRAAELSQAESAIEADRRSLNEMVAEGVSKKLEQERSSIAELAQRNAKDLFASELQKRDLRIAALQEVNEEQERRLGEARTMELAVQKEKLLIEQSRADLDVTIERMLNERMREVRETAKAQAEDRYRIEIQERDLQIDQLRHDIEHLRQRAEQGSQQLQGEAQEVTVEQTLRSAFPQDQIAPVKKGESGGDVVQTVVTQDGQLCEPILVESKRTKSWNGEWLNKLRSDQREVHAAHAILVTQTPPKGVTTFAFVEGVWVVTRPFLVPVMSMLRQGVIHVCAARVASAGRQTKAELVYDYLTRGDFARRVNTVADALHALRAEYQLRRRRIQRDLAQEEQRINRADAALMQLVGDFQGIAGDKLAVEAEERHALVDGSGGDTDASDMQMSA